MFSRAHQAWRMHPWLRQRENLKHALPGFGTALAIFGTYTFAEAFYEKAFAKKESHVHKTAPASGSH